jgi:hypothetical protein
LARRIGNHRYSASTAPRHEADHGPRDGSFLRAYAQNCTAERGVDLAGGRILLLCYPRLLGLRLQSALRLVPRPRAAPETGLATTKVNDYTAPALSAHAKD